MDWLLYVAVFLLVLGLLYWIATPYRAWRFSQQRSLEGDVAKTSFTTTPGALTRSVWEAPSVYLSVVIPAYNEEYRIPQMLDETITYLDQRTAMQPATFTYEIIVVDDGSVDQTYAAALGAMKAAKQQSSDNLRVISLTQNMGKGFAVRVGMLAARGKFLLMTDADGATSFRDLERLEQPLLQQQNPASQIAFGSRHHLQDEAVIRRSWIRNILMFGFHTIVWILIGGSIKDTQCGFKLFTRDAGKRLFSSLHLFRWAFDTELVVLASILSLEIVEVPVTWTEMPGSKLNIMIDAITMLRDILALRCLYGFGIWCPATVGSVG